MKKLSSILTATSSALFATRDENSAMGLKAFANMHINSEGTTALTEVWFNNNPFQSLTTFAHPLLIRSQGQNNLLRLLALKQMRL